ncbi:MAG: Gfo/Idh/MocA family protein [Cyclobacteriaceae bacterium]
MYSRRKFIQNSSAVLAGAGIAGAALPVEAIAQSRKKGAAASDKVIVGLIGCKGMGMSNLRSILKLPQVECKALCDVDQNILEERAQDLVKMGYKKPVLYKDYRKMLEDKEIDAVIIATPDHWHCLPFIHACEAGKDIYCEKPMANYVEECNLMVKATKKYDRVVQLGQWQRSNGHFKKAVEFVQSGKLGRIRMVKVWAYQGWMNSVPPVADAPVPKGVDYDMWLGPAPERPFNQNRFHFTFRWFWDYAGGLMTDWGVHLLDVALWGMNATAPISVMSAGGKYAYPDDPTETPDTQQAVYEFKDFMMVWDHAIGIDSCNFNRNHGIAFIGNNGTLIVDRGGWEVVPEVRGPGLERAYLMDAVPKHGSADSGLDKHMENFVECIKTRALPNCHVDTGSLAAINAHLGNIALKTGRKLYWDAAKGNFGNDAEANKMLVPDYRSPWKLPVV